MSISTSGPGSLRGGTTIPDPAKDLFAITGLPAQVPAATRDFFRLLFHPADAVLLRWVESWAEEDPATAKTVKMSGPASTGHVFAGDLASGHHPLDRRFYTWAGMLARTELGRANLIFGVCPRVRPRVVVEGGAGGCRSVYSWDKAWQIRTVRALWADLDGCLPDEALRRCAATGLPPPSIVVFSGYGTHLYWLLSLAYLIDDAPTPGPWVTEYANGKRVAEYGLELATGVRFDRKPEISPQGLRVQEVVAGVVAAVGGDAATHDLARCLRVPGSLNRKDQRNGKPPVPCEVVEIDGGRRYSLDDFESFRVRAALAEVAPPASRRVELPTVAPGEGDGAAWPAELEELVGAAAVAEDRSKAEFRVCCRAIELGVGRDAVRERLRLQGKVRERGDDYLDRTWANALSRVGKQAHSRRLEGGEAAPPVVPRVSLEQARRELNEYLAAELSRDPQPGVLHLIKVPPGVGKTFSACKLIGEYGRKAIVLTLENKLAATHQSLINRHGGDARRMPVLRESDCPHPDAYEAMSRRGFRPSQSYPCRGCKIGPRRCKHLISFSSLDEAGQLCGPAVYHTHEGFYEAHGNEERPVVVLDESFVDLLLEPVAHPLDDWLAWGRLVRAWADATPRSTGQADSYLRLVAWLKEAAAGFMAAGDGRRKPPKHALFQTPGEVKYDDVVPPVGLEGWLHANARREGHRSVPNLLSAASYLLAAPDSHVFLERISRGEGEDDNVVVRFRRRNPLPLNREVFLLDATANADLVRAILPGWEVRVWECPPVEQKGKVIQIADRDVSRGFIKRELKRHGPHNPSWLVQVLDRVLGENGPMPVATFKKVAVDPDPGMDLLGALQRRDGVSARYNFPCRGHTFADESLLVLGTPYPNEVSYHELAFAIWGQDGLPRSAYERRYRQRAGWSVDTMGFEEPHLLPLEEHFVNAELAQAVGRLRPLENDCTVFVVTSAWVPIWEVERASASDLWDLTKPLRRDAGDRFGEYARAAAEVAAAGGKPTNAAVCAAVGLPERTGRRYRARLKSKQADEGKPDADGYQRYAAEVRRLLEAGQPVGNADVYKSLGIPERTGRRYMERFKHENNDRIEVVGRKVKLLASGVFA